MRTAHIVRHGEDGYDGLTARGVQQIQEASRSIRTELEDVEELVIYHSPLARAVQSAEVMRDELRPIRAELEERAELASGSYRVAEVVRSAQRFPCVVISHQPDLQDYLERYHGIWETLRNGAYVRVEI